MSQNSILVETLDEDRFARRTQITLGEKVIQTPNFCTLIQNPEEFEALMSLCLLSGTQHLGGYVIRIFDTLNTILPRLQRQDQMEINGRFVEELFRNFNRRNIIFIDPSMEYLLYEFHAGKFLRVLKRITRQKQVEPLIRYLEQRNARKEKPEASNKPEDLTDYESWKKAHHRKFWYDLDRNPMERSKFVGDLLDLESMCGTDVIIPPVPIVDSEGMLDIALRINALSKAIAPRTKLCATYLMLQKGVLRNDTLVEKILTFLKGDRTQLTILKIKNLDLWNPGLIVQRESYKKLMDTMFEIRRKDPNKLYVALENWYQSFPSACYGFNLVSTSMYGFDRDSDYGSTPYGSWYDPDLMWHVSFEDLKTKTMPNNENRLPCYCPICKQISDLNTISKEDWYILRRKHYVLTMNAYMRMISQAIEDRNIEHAREKLKNSELSKLKTLLPSS